MGGLASQLKPTHTDTMMLCKRLLATLLLYCMPAMSYTETVLIHMNNIEGAQPRSVGYLWAEDTRYGLLITPYLHALPPGLHGFHVHTQPNCSQHGTHAGGHLDPYRTGRHLGPYNPKGHLGDLPALYVNAKGQARLPILAPRLTVHALRKHSIMIHAHADNYRDQPKPNGGGGARLACGVVPAPHPQR